jgi:ribosome maturation factor RimP
MTRTEIEDKISALVEPLLVETQLELVDVEYVQEREWYLRIFIDKPGGIGIDDCEQLSRNLEPILDEVDYLKQAYYLEVSSPGLDRVLRREKDFVRYAGKLVDIKFYRPREGVKEVTASLKGLQDGVLCVENKGREVTYPQDEIAQVRLHIDMGKGKK